MQRVSLSRVIEKLQKVKEYENYYSALCVFHDDTKPSMLVYKDGWFRCLACGKTGDLYLLDRKLNGWSSRSMVLEGELTSWTIPKTIVQGGLDFAMKAHEVLLTNSESLSWYLRMRGIENRIEPQKLGWYNGWYTFPVFNEEGYFKGIILRAGLHIEQAKGLRYVTPTKEKYYVPDWQLNRNNNYLVVVFGIIDALTLTELRIPNISTIHGLNCNPDDFDDIRKPIIFFPDKGEEPQAIEVLRKLGWRGRLARINWSDSAKDVNDLYLQGKTTQIFNAIEAAR